MTTETTRETASLADLRRDRSAASNRMTELVGVQARGRSLTDDEQRDFDAASREFTALDERITSAEAIHLPPQKPAGGTAASAALKPVDLVADMKRRHGIAA